MIIDTNTDQINLLICIIDLLSLIFMVIDLKEYLLTNVPSVQSFGAIWWREGELHADSLQNLTMQIINRSQ